MLVAIITSPLRPAWAISSPSRSACSGLAFSTACLIPSRLSAAEIISETSTETVPTRTGWPFSWRSTISSSTAFHLPSLVLKIWSLWSSRTIGWLVGISTTGIS